MSSILDNIRIVLVNTFHPGNIGSAARAMSTMGLRNLYLVAPKCFPDPEASAMAASSEAILDGARVVPSLAEAIADCRLVIGTSARSRSDALAPLDPLQTGEQLIDAAAQGPVALLFGRERSGLTNEEIQQCHYQAMIATDTEHSVLNMAAAVQLFSYEVRRAWLAKENLTAADAQALQSGYATRQELDYLYEHLEQVLQKIDFIYPKNPGKTMLRLERLFNRARLEDKELRILRGVLAQIEYKLTNKPKL